MIENCLDLFSQWLVTASFRASVIALIAAALQMVLGRWLPARWRYALWLSVVVVLVFPLRFSNPWGVEYHIASHRVAAVTATLDTLFQAPPAELASGDAEPVVTPWRPSRSEWLFAGWLVGAVSILTTGALSYRRTLRRFNRSAVEVDAFIIEVLTAALREAGLRRAPRLLVSTAVETPAVTGIIRQTLLLPAGFSESYTSHEARLILLHELTHLRRMDVHVNWLLSVIQAIHWFNPLVWLVFRWIRADCEAACDAEVLSAYKEDRRREYGCALVKVGSLPVNGRLDAAFLGISDFTQMKLRLRAIARHRPAHPAWAIASMLLIAGLIVLGDTRMQKPDAMEAVGNRTDQTSIQVECRIADAPVEANSFDVFADATPNYTENPKHVTMKLSSKGSKSFFRQLSAKGATMHTASVTIGSGQAAKMEIDRDSLRRQYGSVGLTVIPVIVNGKLTVDLKVESQGVVNIQSKR